MLGASGPPHFCILTLWQQLREPDARAVCVPSPVLEVGLYFIIKDRTWCGGARVTMMTRVNLSYLAWEFFFSIFMMGLLCVALAVLQLPL